VGEYLKKMVDYSNDVLSGEVIACKKHKWACLRFLNDLKRSKNNDPDFPYIFNEERAQLFEDWCGLFKHTKGTLTGTPIELVPITHFIFGNLYGWYNKNDDERRFSNSYWQVGRKNAKTQLHACVGLYETFSFRTPEQAEVKCIATKKAQAEITLKEAKLMLKQCDYLEEDEDYHYAKFSPISCPTTDSEMTAASRNDKDDGDGWNVSTALIDEYHAHKSTELLDIALSSQGARKSALASIITTAGLHLENPCYRIEYQLVSKILDPDNPFQLEEYFVMINELEVNTLDETIEVDGKKIAPGDLIDDINDESMWLKANPIAATHTVGIKKLRKELKIARESPENMPHFLTKYMNVWVNHRALGYMDLGRWGACGYDGDLIALIAEKTDKKCWVGMDLSKKEDLTSVWFEFLGSDEKYYVIGHSFMPEDGFAQKIKNDRVPYDLWEKQGYLTVTEGSVVDYRAVKDYILKTIEKNGWVAEEVDIDPYAAIQLTGDFIDGGLEVVEIQQRITVLSEPTKDFRYMVYEKRVVHGNDPLLTWAMGNCVTRTDINENIMLNKSKAIQRIDPIAAGINAHTRAMYVEAKPQNRVMFI